MAPAYRVRERELVLVVVAHVARVREVAQLPAGEGVHEPEAHSRKLLQQNRHHEHGRVRPDVAAQRHEAPEEHRRDNHDEQPRKHGRDHGERKEGAVPEERQPDRQRRPT